MSLSDRCLEVYISFNPNQWGISEAHDEDLRDYIADKLNAAFQHTLNHTAEDFMDVCTHMEYTFEELDTELDLPYTENAETKYGWRLIHQIASVLYPVPDNGFELNIIGDV